MPGSLLESRPGSNNLLAPRRHRLGGVGAALQVARPSAIRDVLYARMEEISFRKFVALLSGAVAMAIAGTVTGILISQPAGVAHPLGLRPPPVTQPISVTSASARATSARPVHAAPRRAKVGPSPASYTSHAAPAAHSVPAGPARPARTTAAPVPARPRTHGSRPFPPRGAGSWWWYWAHNGRAKLPRGPRDGAGQGNTDPRAGDPRGGATGGIRWPRRGGW
ncbi:MAG TPA: hypothetical protein VE733_18655 [Streptosporangiaceae bacterium]|nr:hypothetical protein [Streptosporangiaceae bacterium]